MLEEARNTKLIARINKLLEKSDISDEISYATVEKDNVYQCIIKYKKNNKWNQFWASTGYKVEKGNLRKANNRSKEIADIFLDLVKNRNSNQQQSNNTVPVTIGEFQDLLELNTTNFNSSKTTKADWDFYEYMEYWLYHVIKFNVAEDTFDGYEQIITHRLKDYFTMPEHKKMVKEINADDLDEFYNYLRSNNLSNATIDHYNDNISNAFKYLLKKKIVRYNPTKLINTIVVDVVEVPTYNQEEMSVLFDELKKDIIEIPTLMACIYGLRRSEIIGLRISAIDFDNDTFVINHVAIQVSGKKHKKKVIFKDKTKSKKGYRTFPMFSFIKKIFLERIAQIEQNKIIFGNAYNHEYDEYLFVQDDGNIIQPGYFTKRFNKIIKRKKLKKVTPHGLRHSIATLLHLRGVDIRDLQDWLGHQNISSTNRYTRSDYKKQVSTGKTVEKIFEGKFDIQPQKTKRYIIKKKNTYVCS